MQPAGSSESARFAFVRVLSTPVILSPAPSSRRSPVLFPGLFALLMVNICEAGAFLKPHP